MWFLSISLEELKYSSVSLSNMSTRVPFPLLCCFVHSPPFLKTLNILERKFQVISLPAFHSHFEKFSRIYHSHSEFPQTVGVFSTKRSSLKMSHIYVFIYLYFRCWIEQWLETFSYVLLEFFSS